MEGLVSSYSSLPIPNGLKRSTHEFYHDEEESAILRLQRALGIGKETGASKEPVEGQGPRLVQSISHPVPVHTSPGRLIERGRAIEDQEGNKGLKERERISVEVGRRLAEAEQRIHQAEEIALSFAEEVEDLKRQLDKEEKVGEKLALPFSLDRCFGTHNSLCVLCLMESASITPRTFKSTPRPAGTS